MPRRFGKSTLQRRTAVVRCERGVSETVSPLPGNATKVSCTGFARFRQSRFDESVFRPRCERLGTVTRNRIFNERFGHFPVKPPEQATFSFYRRHVFSRPVVHGLLKTPRLWLVRVRVTDETVPPKYPRKRQRTRTRTTLKTVRISGFPEFDLPVFPAYLPCSSHVFRRNDRGGGTPFFKTKKPTEKLINLRSRNACHALARTVAVVNSA